jgi:hypothetical protein
MDSTAKVRDHSCLRRPMQRSAEPGGERRAAEYVMLDDRCSSCQLMVVLSPAGVTTTSPVAAGS